MRCRRSADNPDVDCGAVVAVRLKPDTTGRVMLPDSSTNRTTMHEIEALITPPQQHPAASVQSTLPRQFKSTLQRQLKALCRVVQSTLRRQFKSTLRRQFNAPYGVSSMLRRCGELRELEHCVPVATRAARAKHLFDHGARQPRTADAVRVDDIGVPAAGANDFPPLDGRLQCVHVLAGWRLLQECDRQVTGIAHRLFTERIIGNDAPPLV